MVWIKFIFVLYTLNTNRILFPMSKLFSKIAIIIFAVLLTLACSKSKAPNPEPEPEPQPEPHPIAAVYTMDIQVAGGADIVSKDDYVRSVVKIDGKEIYPDLEVESRVRGRGNSTWRWYPKKPYRLKFDDNHSVLGLDANKDWVLLANYRDPTHLMNAFSFQVGQWLGIPYTNHSRFVELSINGEYMGLYQLTEQVEIGNGRVDIDEGDGVLLSLDVDDGPDLAPDEGDNFWSSVFRMPVAIKHPEDLTPQIIEKVRGDFGALESAINAGNYAQASAIMNMPVFIDFLILQELVYNVELAAPRSTNLYRDKGGKYTMGPIWDFDAGFDFDWGTMYTGHNYFADQKLVLGTDPYNQLGGNRVPRFFTEMFKNKQFVTAFKNRWKQVKDGIVKENWEVMDSLVLLTKEAMARDYQRWPIDRHYNTEISRMKLWLNQRVEFLDRIIQNYPPGTL
jgi:hypothetical protein